MTAESPSDRKCYGQVCPMATALDVIGDRWTDVQLAHAVGGRGILVKTGYGATQVLTPPAGRSADAVADNLFEAVGWIVRHVDVPRPA